MSSLPPPSPPLDDLPSAPPGPRFRPTALIAWLVIIGVCVALPLLRAERKAATVPTTGPAPLGAVDFQTELAGRMWLGGTRLIESPAEREKLNNMVGMQSDTAVKAIAMATVLAEAGEHDRAVELLQSANDPAAAELLALYAAVPPTARPTTRPTTNPTTATAVAAAGTSPASTPSSRPALSHDTLDRLGWFGRLAGVYGLPDSDPERAAVLAGATHTLAITAGGLTIVGGAAVLGIALFVVAIVLIATGRIRSRVGRPIGPGYAYVEGVAIYLAGFVVVSLGLALLWPSAPMAVQLGGLFGMAGLGAVWPLVRGGRWADVRVDLGVHTGEGIIKEMAAGVGGYLAGLPVIAVGLFVTVVLLSATGANGSHPITQQVGDHSLGTVLSLYFLASVFAPVTEELMFRGALVSHLRAGVNVALAAAISGFVFGAVHPQGWAVVPALMGVGAVLACVRQWRGSLIASITAHALHNGFLITVMTLATR